MDIYLNALVIAKESKDPSCSLNYHAVALASSVSKVLKHLIFKKYSSSFCTSLVSNQAILYNFMLLRTLFRAIHIEVPLFWGVFRR